MKIIAEAGINHHGELETAKRLIDLAASAGCEYVKFQFYDTDRLFGKDFQFYEDSKRAMLDLEQLKTLKDYAAAQHPALTWFTSVFHADYVPLAHDILRQPVFKIASVSVPNHDLLRAVARTGKPVIMSTGAHGWDVLDRAAAMFNDVPLTLLYCVSKYPARFEDFDFTRLEQLADRYSVPVGLSDHSPTLSAGLVAQTMGAELYEHHITLSRFGYPNCDASSSWEPEELRRFVRSVRELDARHVPAAQPHA